MNDMIDAAQSTSLKQAQTQAQSHNRLDGEVDEILNHTIGPESYHRDDILKRQVTTHYRLNLMRMIRIAHSADAGVILVKPVINIRDMSPFKSEHREGLGEQAQRGWEKLFQHATDLYVAGDFSEALNAYQQALGLDDRYADLHYRIGKTHFKLRQYDQAEQSFRRAVEEDIAPLRILASMQQIVEEVAALRHYYHALQIKPDYLPAHVELACLLVSHHRYDEAHEHAQAALRINPKQYRAHNVLDLIRKNQGKSEQAIQHFREALRLQPGYIPAKENLQQVQMVLNRKALDDDRS